MLAFKFAIREMRGGLRGFYIFIGCIALGVAAISGVGSVAKSITKGISAQGQVILGGDISFSLVQRELSAEQKSFLESKGKVTDIVTMRAMARLPDGADQTLVELKAVDEQYPNYGELRTGEHTITGKNIEENAAFADPLLFERLNLKIGDLIEIGSSRFVLYATLENEPDRVGDNIGFGPKVLISRTGLDRTGLIQPGSLLRYHAKLKLDDPSPENTSSIIKQAKQQFPDSGWRIRSRENAAPALTRSIDRFSQFLTLVGLTSLIVGGVGVANATRAFLETKRSVIATLKSVGAKGNLIFNIYLIQILIMASVGIIIGLAMGIGMPYLARSAMGGILPVSEGTLWFPSALAPGVLFGYLTALIFATWPLALSKDIQPTDLFRSSAYQAHKTWPQLKYIFAVIVYTGILISTAIYFSDNRFVAIVFICAILASFVLLQLVAWIIKRIAKAAPKPGSTALRMAIANIHRPGSLTSSVILSLGLGLALLVALATIDGNLRSQITNNLPEDAPDFFFVDIQNTEIDAFKSTLTEMTPAGKIISVPMLRGKVVSLRGVLAAEADIAPGGEWVLRGDRGITYAKNVPENSTLASGEWWPEDYLGEPLVSVSAEEAGELGLSIGDEIVINVLGRNISAKIASFREVQWETLGVNFVFVFSPNTFAGAPHSWLATLTSGQSDADGFDGKLLKRLSKDFPAITAVRIRDALKTVNTLIEQLSTAIRAAASVALFSSVLVLAGALAAGNRERVHDTVVLKTLGATRKTLIKTLVYEYSLLGLATAIFAVLAGSIAAWFVISVIMSFTFLIQPTIATTTVITALAFTIILGLIGTWRILGQKAAPVLREL